MKKILFILSFVLYGFTHAQTHEWAEPFVPITINQFNFVQTKALAIDGINNSYVVGIYNSDFTINNDTIPLKSNYYNGVNNCVAKFNSLGNFKWVKTQYLYTINSSNTGSPPAYFSNINVISDNKILVHGYFNRGGNGNESNVSAILKLSDTDSIINASSNSLNTVGFYVIYDSTGNIVKFDKVFEGNISSSLWNGQLVIDEQKNIYLLVKGTSGTVYSDKVNTNLTFSTFNSVLIKFTADFDSIAWYKIIATHTGTNYYITSRIRIGLNDNNIYLASLIRMESSGTITIDNIEYAQYLQNNFTKGLLTILSPSGDFIHNGFINADLSQQDNAFDVIAFDTSRIYITGHVQDSILYGGQWFTSTGSPSNKIAYPYIAKISVTKADWIKLPQEKTEQPNIAFFYGGFNNRINIDKKGFVYSYFEYHNNILSMGGLTDSGSVGKMGFIKLDSLGNALWLRLGVAVTDMQVDTSSDLVYCGVYSNDSLKLLPFTLPLSQRASGFIAKITDYSITRGDVFMGPYCAGDTFYVPYTKTGEYDTANWFFAELSDENGNFEGEERELGRIKATEDSTIIGQLPLFQVASSGNYRIRVRSTHPPVQSFYRLDSLRLLIYSRDKADPGPAETVCFGDSFQLRTFGGTAWQWSPAYNIDDSTSRTPFIIPDKDTVYRIVISDSSGCGEADTAFKQIFVRSLPNITTDSVVEICQNEEITLKASFSNGDSNTYKWTWFEVGESSWQQLKSDSFTFIDSLVYSFSNPATTLIALVLEDGCSKIKDTAFIQIRLTLPLLVSFTPQDTLLCKGQEISFIANGEGGISNNYQFKWLDKETEELLSETDTLTILSDNSRYFYLILSDNCMESDTSEVQINVRPSLKAVILREFLNDIPIQDTTVCSGSELEFFAKGSGGDSTNYSYEWYLDDNILGSDSSISILLNGVEAQLKTQHLKLIIKDACSPPDTSSITINVLPPLKSNFVAPDTICSGEEMELIAYASGGIDTNYSYQWEATNEKGDWILIGNSDTINFKPSTVNNSTLTTQHLKLVLSDGCSSPNDTFEQEIYVRPALSLDLSPSTLCANPTTTLTAIPSGGNPANYLVEWYDQDNTQIGNGETLIVTPNELTTYKVILSDGCSEPNAEVQVQIDKLPTTLELLASPTEGCEPLEVEYSVNTNYPLGFSTIIHYGAPDSITGNNRYTYQEAGTYYPRLEFRGDGGCTTTISGPEITVHPKPLADFTFVPDEPSLDKPKVNFNNLSSGAINYQWNLDPFGEFTDFEPEVSYQDSGRFSIRLIAFSDQGCSDTLEGELFVKSPERMFIPTAFSPNGDGLNDVFEPKVRGYDVAEFSIFNRWGEKIFSSQGTGWDGTYNSSPAQIGVYTYTLLLVDEKGEKLLFTGTVSLMR